jgi:hypothetical protein
MEAKLATNYPTSKDNLTNPAATESMEGHAALHGTVNDAIEAIENKLGVNGSTDVNSIDYKVSQLETNLATLDAENASELLGLDGNNDLTIDGIENKTAIDSFSKTVYKTAKYSLQIHKSAGNLTSTSNILLLNDGNDVHISESDIVSNTDQTLANITFEENNGIISLCVTPVSGSVKVRYFRTALKA